MQPKVYVELLINSTAIFNKCYANQALKVKETDDLGPM